MATNWQQNADDNYKISCHTIEKELATILEPVFMEHKTIKMDLNHF